MSALAAIAPRVTTGTPQAIQRAARAQEHRLADGGLIDRKEHRRFTFDGKAYEGLGGDIDGYNSYAQRGNMPILEDVIEEGASLLPLISRVRMLRSWGGVMDMSMDGSPVIGRTPVENLYLNCGWCIGGFKATPASGWCFAHTIARDEPHALNARYTLERFATGDLIDEKGTGAFPWLQ